METLVIEFTEKQIRFIKINEKKEILFIDEINSNLDLNHNLSDYKINKDIVSETRDVICNHLEENNIRSKSAGVLLNTSHSFLNVVPIDYNEDNESIKSQLLWELSNYFPGSYKNHRISYHKLNRNDHPGKIKDTLLIAVENSKIDLIKNVFEACNLKINLTDIDQFASEKCIREVYTQKLKDNGIILLGCKNSRIDISIMDEKSLIYYDYVLFPGNEFQEGLRTVVDKLNVVGNVFDNIILFGEDYAIDVCNYLASNYKVYNVELSDPFKKFNYKGNKKEITNNAFMYTALVGLALKCV